MGTKEVKPVKTDKAPMDIRKISSLWNWTATVDGKSIGGPYQLPMVIRQLEDRGISEAVVSFNYKA